MGEPGEAVGKYIGSPFAEGFVQGYLTMDVLSALVFGIVILQALRDMGMKDTKSKSIRRFLQVSLLLSAYHLFISHLAISVTQVFRQLVPPQMVEILLQNLLRCSSVVLEVLFCLRLFY